MGRRKPGHGAGPFGRARDIAEPGDGVRGAVGRDESHRLRIGIGDEQVAGAVEGERHRPAEPHATGGAIAGAERLGHTVRRGDGAADDLADGGVVGVGHEDLAGGIHRHRRRVAELHLDAGAVARAEAVGRGVAGDRRHGAIRGDAADQVVEGVGHDEVAVVVEREALRVPEARVGPGAIGLARLARGAGERGDDARRRDLADRVVERVGHVDRAVGGRENALGLVETRRRTCAVGRAGGSGGTRERRGNAGGRDPADRGVERVGHVEVARTVAGECARLAKARRGSGSVARGRSDAGEGGDDARRRDAADRVVARVGHVERAVGQRGETGRKIELRGRARAGGTARMFGSAGQRGDRRAARGDPAHGVVAGVRHEHVARRIHGDGTRQEELRREPRGIGGAGDSSGAGQRGDRAGGGDFANGVVARISDVEIARTIERQTGRLVDAGGAPLPVRRTRAARIAGADRDRAGADDAAHDVVPPVGEVDGLAVGRDGDAARGVHGRIGRREIERGDDARRGDLANRAVGGVGDVDIARRVDCQVQRRSEARGGPGGIGRAPRARRTGKRGDGARRRDLADGAVAGVGDVEVAVLVARHAGGIEEPRGSSGTIDGAGTDRAGEDRESGARLRGLGGDGDAGSGKQRQTQAEARDLRSKQVGGVAKAFHLRTEAKPFRYLAGLPVRGTGLRPVAIAPSPHARSRTRRPVGDRTYGEHPENEGEKVFHGGVLRFSWSPRRRRGRPGHACRSPPG